MTGPTSEARDENSLRAMTFNLRNSRSNDGENAWSHRREQAIALIRAYDLDVLGVQEAYLDQLTYLREELPEYGDCGVGRDDGATQGEHSQFFYRRDRLRLQEHGTFWFSDTPEVTASRTWGNRLPRICTWARLEELGRQRSFYVYNLHLDHECQPAREHSALLLLDRIRGRAPTDPVLVMGDFNAEEENPAVRTMARSPDPALQDTFRALHPGEPNAATFHGFRGGTSGGRIDYLFASPEFRVVEAAVVRDHCHGRYPSDHYPVFARLVLD